jgi:pyruvate formate lyase activating enzyme
MVEEPREKQVTIEVNGMAASVPERISVREALALLGYPTATYPSDQGVFSPCRVGGCWSCALDIDGQVRLACLTPVRGGMHIATRLPQDFVPRRIVHGFMGHTVGGVGTPWHLKTGTRYIEVACFAAGCNFRCPQCQNWTTTYRGEGDALTPRQAAGIMTQTRIKFGVDRMAISGGECTLNRPWLVAYIRELSALNPDREARLHVDTNGSLFTRDYIDELVAAGMTDIGIDLKALRVGTFMRITGLKDAELARKYMETAWQAAGYCLERYDGQIFTGIGVPFNRALISLEEVGAIGIRIRD